MRWELLGPVGGDLTLWRSPVNRISIFIAGRRSLNFGIGPINDLAVSRDGKWLASVGRDHTARLWDIHTGEELARYLGHSGRVWSVDFSPDGKTLATGGGEEGIRLWSTAPKREGEILTHTSGGNHIGYSPDGRFLFLDELEINRVTLWDAASKTNVQTLPGRDITYSPDGKILTLDRVAPSDL